MQASDQPQAGAGKPRSLLARLGPAGPLALIWTVAPAIMGGTLLAFLPTASEWLRSHGEWGLVVYVGLFILLAGIGVLPTYSQSILGGWVFGIALGLPAALVGFTGGAVLGYGISRLASRHRVEQIINENPKARAIRDALIGKGYWRTFGIVTLIRLNSPFSLTNLVMASTKVPLAAYVPGTALGLLPRTAACVAFAAVSAAKAASLEESAKRSPWWLIVAGAVVTLIVLAIIGQMAARAVHRMNAAPATDGAKDTPVA